ncbi:hypothetical protein [Mechercharimyces sp. CAU 1602]|uniref:hypothetical protein n=1 Tax=Mechercharimyces sp. CAU 1602 TaxID=2973933 RepID=UPI0021611C21|nr:hypothetical protein [Mechercharimyces sp. CAU 1602]MCS1351174.1 hypothetical protein [Mechercharimyces sp. CAU 1602]
MKINWIDEYKPETFTRPMLNYSRLKKGDVVYKNQDEEQIYKILEIIEIRDEESFIRVTGRWRRMSPNEIEEADLSTFKFDLR